MTDICESVFCSDIALPGHDFCAGCIADRQAERELTGKAAAAVTAEHEARIFNDEEAAA